MAITYQRFFAPQLIPAADTVVYQVATNPPQLVLKSLRVRLANTTNAAATVTLNAVPAGGAAGAANTCLPGITINAGDWLDVDVPDMAAGDALHALSGTANAITISQLDGFLKS